MGEPCSSCGCLWGRTVALHPPYPPLVPCGLVCVCAGRGEMASQLLGSWHPVSFVTSAPIRSLALSPCRWPSLPPASPPPPLRASVPAPVQDALSHAASMYAAYVVVPRDIQSLCAIPSSVLGINCCSIHLKLDELLVYLFEYLPDFVSL